LYNLNISKLQLILMS